MKLFKFYWKDTAFGVVESDIFRIGNITIPYHDDLPIKTLILWLKVFN